MPTDRLRFVEFGSVQSRWRSACASAQVEGGETYCMWPVGTTPLHIAAAKGHLNISKLMLQAQVRAVAGAAVLLHNVL